MVNSTVHQASKTCFHCGTSVPDATIFQEDKFFCCTGCLTVFQILSQNDLCAYYDLNVSPGKTAEPFVRDNRFDCLDVGEVASRYLVFKDEECAKAVFHLPHIHCSSCLWLLEKLPSLQPGIISARVSFQRKEIQISFLHEKISLKNIAALLASVGYEPLLSLEGVRKADSNKAQRKRIMRMGVAGFCLGNIMLLSFPEYLNLSETDYRGALMYWFRYLSLALSLPVFFYSAMEFLKPAWQSLRKGFLTIDAPVSLAIIITFIRSVTDIITDSGGGYLDSMSGIVFLMLVGRVLQNRTQAALTFDRDYTSYFPVAAHRIEDGKEVPVLLTSLKAGDIIKVHQQEIVPADGILSKGTALIDYSFVTGESVPVSRKTGELIYAGGRQMEGVVELLLVKDVSKSYLTGLWNQASQERDGSDAESFIHPLAKNFTWLLFLVTAGVAFYWYLNDASYVWPVVTAMLIVACPCALLLSATFTFGHMVAALDRFGFYVRNHAVLEKLLKVSHFIFDKTGTLTASKGYKISQYGDELTVKEIGYLQAMAAQSQHPLSRALASYLQPGNELELQHVKETAGSGVEAWIDEKHIKLGSALFTNHIEPLSRNNALVCYQIDRKKQGYFELQTTFRPGVTGMLRKLMRRGKITLLSGDQAANKAYLQQRLGTAVEVRLAQTPHDKKKYIEEAAETGERMAMIGDGLNDAGALQEAYVGIAVTEQINNFSPASDAIIDAGKLHLFNRLLLFINRGQKVIRFSFAISLLYNFIGLWFAASGNLSPLIAAILMPASSISIIVITWVGVWWLSRSLLGVGGHVRD